MLTELNRRIRIPFLAGILLLLGTCIAWAIGFEFGENKEKLKLDYTVKMTDHGTGRVTFVVTLKDEGRIKPVSNLKLMFKAKDGSNWVDLSVSLGTEKHGKTRIARVHLLKELAERAEIHLITSTLDGKQSPLTWYYHNIPLKKYMKDKKKDK